MNKTNAIRILESHRIEFDIKEYEVDEDDLSGESVAEKIGATNEEVFKTLVAKGDRSGYCVFCIPVNFELDLKKAARASGNKSVDLIKVKELFPLTGYVRGGCSPIGMKKLFPTYIDETAQLFDRIYVSAGIRGMQVHLNPTDLKNLIDAEFADLI